MTNIQYPFVPKSTAHMREGQFWDIPLSNGRFACGRVLQFNMQNGKRHSRIFLAGLIDWCGKKLPTVTSIAGRALLRQGAVHIQTITWNKGAIRGWRSLEEDNIEPLLELSQIGMGKGCYLQRGFEFLRPATAREQKTLYVHSGWGLEIIKLLAEDYFVKKHPPVRKLPWQEYQELVEFVRRFETPSRKRHRDS